MESGIEVNTDNFTSIRVKYNEGTARNELAARIINKSLEPVIELEKAGVLKDISVVLHGGTVTKPNNKPKDYDVMVIYNSFQEPKNPKALTNRAQSLIKRIFSDGKLNENVGTEINIVDETKEERRVSAKYIDFWLNSKKSFIEDLHQSPEDITQQAFGYLSLLPSEIVKDYPSFDFGSYTNEQIDTDTRTATVFVLILGKAFNHKFSNNEIANLCEFFGKREDTPLGKVIGLDKAASGNIQPSQIEEGIVKYLNENMNIMEPILPKDLFQELKNVISNRLPEEKIAEFAKQFRDAYLDKLPFHTKYEGLIGGRVRWLTESVINKVNPNMNAAKHGLLIYGENIKESEKALFKEDVNFLKA